MLHLIVIKQFIDINKQCNVIIHDQLITDSLMNYCYYCTNRCFLYQDDSYLSHSTNWSGSYLDNCIKFMPHFVLSGNHYPIVEVTVNLLSAESGWRNWKSQRIYQLVVTNCTQATLYCTKGLVSLPKEPQFNEDLQVKTHFRICSSLILTLYCWREFDPVCFRRLQN